MSDGGDPAIKLFGKTIPLAERQTSPETREILDLDEKDSSKEITSTEIRAPMSDDQQESDNSKPGSSFVLNNVSEDDRQTSALDVKVIEASKTEPNDSEFDTSSQEKALKKPDKILPCPRCNSLATKFCYYNNYNINQPRHFCKNCQRYWTAGGTMRNVPEGAGRRKSKHSASHYRKITISSDGFPCNTVGIPDSSHQPASGVLKGNESVIKFGPEAKCSESMNSVFNLGDEKKYMELGSDPGEKREETECASFTVKSDCAENDCAGTEVKTKQCETRACSNGVDLDPMHHMQRYPLPPYVIPWTPTWNNVAAMPAACGSSEMGYGPDNGNQNPFTWNPSAMLAAPAFFSTMIAFPVMPAPFWGCVANWPNGACSAPCSGLLPSLSSVSNGGCSANGSPTLGKHSRIAAGLDGEEKMEKKSLWAPKTLRICDPDESSKSSIWAALDIKPGEAISNGDGVFKSFRSKTVRKDQMTDVNQVLHANPAALCRSQTFQEST